MSRRATPLVLVSSAMAGLLQLLAARPGWMSQDSVDMWKEATREVAFQDLHTPLLSWVWSFMAPGQVGPLGPFVIQIVAFWLGVAALGLVLARNHLWIGVLLPWALLSIPQEWIVGYVWKDAALLACLVIALALFGWLSVAHAVPRVVTWPLASAIGAALGAAVLVRWYLLPGVLVLAAGICLLLVVRYGKGMVLVVAAGLGITIVLGFTIQESVIKPERRFNDVSALMFDLARLQCKSSPGVAVPSQLVIAGTSPYCDRISAHSITTLFFPAEDSAEKLRWPTADDVKPVRDAWFDALRTRPADMFEVKVEYFMWSLLLRPETYLQPLGNPEQATLFNTTDGSTGIGDSVGFPSLGGVFTLLASLPQSVTIGLFFPSSVMSPIWFVAILPLCAGVWRHRRWRDAGRWSALLASPVVLVANFAVISLNASTRLTAPMVVLAALVSLLAITEPPLRRTLGEEPGADPARETD